MATNAQPIACTLSGKDLRDRRAWIADLARDGLLSHQRGDLALCLAGPPATRRAHARHRRQIGHGERSLTGATRTRQSTIRLKPVSSDKLSARSIVDKAEAARIAAAMRGVMLSG